MQLPGVPAPLFARAGMLAPLSDTVESPGVAVTTPPAQVVEAIAGLAIVSGRPVDPVGSRLLTVALLTADADRFDSVIVSFATVPSDVLLGVKLLLIVMTSIRVMLAELPLLLHTGPAPLFSHTPPAPIAFTWLLPGADPVGVIAEKLTSQRDGLAPLPAFMSKVSTMLLVDGAGPAMLSVNTPAQPLPLMLGAGLARPNMPVGRLSVICTPVSAPPE